MRISATLPLVALILAFILAGCGTPGAPLPPSLNLPQPVTDLSAVRVGDQINVSFRVPVENTDHLPLKSIGLVEFEQCRNPGPSTCPLLQQWKAGALKPGELVTFTTALPSEDYVGVFVLNDRGSTAGGSNQVYIPHQSAWPNPRSVTAKTTADAVVIALNIPAATPPLESQAKYFYRILRSQAGQQRPQTIAEIPATQSEFRDMHFEWQQRYTYEIHTINRVTYPSGNAIEFESGAPVSVTIETTDVFPPPAPTGLAAIFNGTQSGKSSIDLSWLPDTSPDLAGYNVYRSRNSGAEEKLNPSPLPAPDFRDFNLEPGADYSYSYSVTAVDVRGNESQRSTPATEHVPQQP